MSDDDFELEPRRVGALEDDSWIDKEDDENSKDKQKERDEVGNLEDNWKGNYRDSRIIAVFNWLICQDSNDSFRPRKRRSQFLDDEAGVDKVNLKKLQIFRFESLNIEIFQ